MHCLDRISSIDLAGSQSALLQCSSATCQLVTIASMYFNHDFDGSAALVALVFPSAPVAICAVVCLQFSTKSTSPRYS